MDIFRPWDVDRMRSRPHPVHDLMPSESGARGTVPATDPFVTCWKPRLPALPSGDGVGTVALQLPPGEQSSCAI